MGLSRRRGRVSAAPFGPGASAWLAVAASLAMVVPVVGQDAFPNRQIHAIVGFAPGSGADIYARYFSKKLEEKSGRNVVVENRVGANGNIAMGMAAKAKPDGYTILFAPNATLAGSPLLMKDVPFDSFKDFTPAALISQSTFVLVTSAKSPVQSVAELTERLRGRSRSTFGYTNQISQLASEAYKAAAGLKTVAVSYRTASDMVPDIVDGTVDFVVIDGTFGTSQIRAGRVKALAVTSMQRHPNLPDVPTMHESGVEGYEWVAWWGVYLPTGAPSGIVQTYGRWLNEITATDETKAFLGNVSSGPLHDGPEGANKRLREDMQRWGAAVKAAGIKPQ